ncbi:hypothetical protein LINGRAHAP2_LOCUS15530 [Linum grandiflorum]
METPNQLGSFAQSLRQSLHHLPMWGLSCSPSNHPSTTDDVFLFVVLQSYPSTH